ncbi:hypothetical protein D3C71_1529930 [compost metagenome]
MKAHATFGHGADEFLAELVRAVAIHQHVHADAAPGGVNQGLLQSLPDLVVEQDEGFHQHFVLGRGDGLVHGGEIALAVFQQRVAVAFPPSQVSGGHSAISADRGTWSDRRDHTREACGTGRQSRTLRT